MTNYSESYEKYLFWKEATRKAETAVDFWKAPPKEMKWREDLAGALSRAISFRDMCARQMRSWQREAGED